MIHAESTNYTVKLHMEDGSIEDIEEWFSLKVAQKIAAKAYDARVSVVNSPVRAIEIVDIDDNEIQIARFD